MKIKVIGPKDTNDDMYRVINTTSHSKVDWQVAFSPFYLGPVKLYDNFFSKNLENGWQYAKCYKEHVDIDGNPNEEYWNWATNGWNNPKAVRYPMGKGAKPEYSYWNGHKYGYVDARLKIYFPMYRDAVKHTEAFEILKEVHKKQNIALWDFDGYDHEKMGMTLTEVLRNNKRPMGHAFVLKSMLLYDDDVTPDDIFKEDDSIDQEFE